LSAGPLRSEAIEPVPRGPTVREQRRSLFTSATLIAELEEVLAETFQAIRGSTVIFSQLYFWGQDRGPSALVRTAVHGKSDHTGREQHFHHECSQGCHRQTDRAAEGEKQVAGRSGAPELT
jgi:hypothetical protein